MNYSTGVVHGQHISNLRKVLSVSRLNNLFIETLFLLAVLKPDTIVVTKVLTKWLWGNCRKTERISVIAGRKKTDIFSTIKTKLFSQPLKQLILIAIIIIAITIILSLTLIKNIVPVLL